MTTAIIVEGVTKRFKLSNSDGIKSLTVNAVKGRRRVKTFTAVDNVSFTLDVGGSIGLMGLNGSGKSTLLKLVSGVMVPDSGKVLTRGRIAGLIEIGAGFHPDLTGRENIYLNGAILGMTETEIDRKYDEILAFSEMENFVESSVRNYSSGMFMRLAFAVAVHTHCDIFLMDEMLAVGDQPFKRKCMRKIIDLKSEGKTMVYVSHSAKQVVRLCDQGIVLSAGQVKFQGSARDAVQNLGYDYGEDDEE
ncbi:MAG: type transport system ATP-binding protein [Nocardioidaceae bacterium]|nr:type transport system ATP-binding protein [Nocardioidaceae bacterium]